MFENLNANNASGYVIHASGQDIQIFDAIKSLTQTPALPVSTSGPRNSAPTAKSAESAEDYSCSSQSSPVGEDGSPDEYRQRY